ncbi:MAG: TIM-barrel domain-containing protein [Lachnospiraceae bacterium]
MPFDVTDEKALKIYFEYGCYPHEELGVDFWWIDWQQGTRTKIEGLDSLWMLNHFHFLDSGKKKKRPMTFSRYAGPGSHRYPIGFSGDSFITWETLDFQPYFTSTVLQYWLWLVEP